MQLIDMNKKYDVMKTQYPINNDGFVINFMSKKHQKMASNIHTRVVYYYSITNVKKFKKQTEAYMFKWGLQHHKNTISNQKWWFCNKVDAKTKYLELTSDIHISLFYQCNSNKSFKSFKCRTHII